MYKIPFTTILIFSFLICFGQREPMIVQGHIKKHVKSLSRSFHQKLFCFKKGNYVLPRDKFFNTFQVDAIISGDFKDIVNQDRSVPFDLRVGLLNECTLLKEGDEVTLRLQKFPTTDYYYVDSISQVSPNKKYEKELKRYHKEHLQTVDILKNGTLQEKKEALDKTDLKRNHLGNVDYRYIEYIVPYLNTKDTILNYYHVHWDGVDKDGKMTGGSVKEVYKQSFFDYCSLYMSRLLPFEMPSAEEVTDWGSWYQDLLLKASFSEIQYAPSEEKALAGCRLVRYFLSDSKNEYAYFLTYDKELYSINKATDEWINLGEIRDRRRTLSFENRYIPPSFDEISRFESQKFIVYKNENGAYYEDIELSLEELAIEKKSTGVSYRDSKITPDFMLTEGDDFILIWGENVNETGNNYIKTGKINRTGDWLIPQKKILDYYQTPYPRSEFDAIHAISATNKNYLIGGAITSYKENDRSAIFVKKINTSLEVIDSLHFDIDIPWDKGHNEGVNKIFLTKNENTYLLIGSNRVTWDNPYSSEDRLYAMILNEELEPQTEFVQFADKIRDDGSKVFLSIPTKEGFVVSWIDESLKENTLRSVLIRKDGKKSNIINIVSAKMRLEYVTEYNKEYLDFYFTTDGKLIRKRVAKVEYIFN